MSITIFNSSVASFLLQTSFLTLQTHKNTAQLNMIIFVESLCQRPPNPLVSVHKKPSSLQVAVISHKRMWGKASYPCDNREAIEITNYFNQPALALTSEKQRTPISWIKHPIYKQKWISAVMTNSKEKSQVVINYLVKIGDMWNR